jgi:hypothetical protein
MVMVLLLLEFGNVRRKRGGAEAPCSPERSPVGLRACALLTDRKAECELHAGKANEKGRL